MISVYSFLYTLVLFSELSSHYVTVAMPAAKVEDGAMEQDGLFLEDEPMTEPALVPAAYRRNFVLDTNKRDEDGSPKIIIVSDMGLRGQSIRGLNPAFTHSFPLLTDRSVSRTPAEHILKIDRRNTDLDIMRCMIGRVYRPCWEA
ncbi:pro-MCH [Notothenia coriiceps]|uniref:Pro-MCH n=1 Tax=Notothenia coriiceps TaxID=8208 RepID=A0A6I9N738_9TELE|nr:PREDICTED: pro-MCH 1-like [Notothenia coriiceps]